MALVVTTNAWELPLASFVSRVLQKCQVASGNDPVSPEDMALARDIINGSLKALHADGLLWWAVKVEAITFEPGAIEAPLPADFVQAVMAYWNGRKVRLVEREEFEAVSDRTQLGQPQKAFIDATTVYLWPVSATGGALRLTYGRALLDVISGFEIDVPKGLLKPMLDLMAAEVWPYFNVPSSLATRLDADGARAMASLRKQSAQRADPAPVQAEYL